MIRIFTALTSLLILLQLFSVARCQELDNIPDQVVFSIYYDNPKKVKDKAFERAAKTEIRRLKKDTEQQFEMLKQFPEIKVPKFHFVVKPVTTKADFVNAWNEVGQFAAQHGSKVVAGSLYMHATKSADSVSGLSFAPTSDGEDTYLNRKDILKLAILPWANSDDETGAGGMLTVNSCNSGLSGERGWNPAEAFSQRQKIICYGMSGYSFFSTRLQRFSRISDSSSEVYLWAYNRRHNANPLKYFGPAMPPRIFVNGARSNQLEQDWLGR